MLEELTSILLKAPLFDGLTPKELNGLLNCVSASTTTYKKNDVIARGGDVFRGVGMIIRGEAVVTKENALGERSPWSRPLPLG